MIGASWAGRRKVTRLIRFWLLVTVLLLILAATIAVFAGSRPAAAARRGSDAARWVTSWGAAIPLAMALRERVLDVHKQRAISAGKGEKMEALYDYLTSPQFAQKLKAVYGAFQGMQEDLQKERNASEQRLARREKQIATGMKELLGFAGDVQGLAQQELPQLEMEPTPAELIQRSAE